MTKYMVKNLINIDSSQLQMEYKKWIETRKHIQLINVNFWKDNIACYCTITYIENEYVG